MIRGMHGLIYSSDPDATRAFIREKLKLPGSDIGEGWWIFDFPEGDLGIHPADVHEGSAPGNAGTHDVSLYCDDIHGTVADLKSRGVELTEVADRGWGLVTQIHVPGGITLQLYEPRYTKGASRPKASATRKRRAARPARRAAKRGKRGTGRK
jgi:catechol 2,3-dioxygenase-like lactoylglutathione lyase family enzyme